MNEKQTSSLYEGVGIGLKKASGRLRYWKSPTPCSPPRRQEEKKETDAKQELERLMYAIQLTEERIGKLFQRALESLGEDEARIFEIHGMLLHDDDLMDAIKGELANGKTAEAALQSASDRLTAKLAALDDPYLSARAADVRDVLHQILLCLTGAVSSEPSLPDEPFLLVAEELSPSETILLEKSLILGFVTFRGTPNSHTAILARAMGIPALVNTGELPATLDGHFALLDAAEGRLTIDPDDEQIAAFSEMQKREERLAREHDLYLRSLLNKPAVTKSGHRMLIYANIGDSDEVADALAGGADGIGLLRSEFLYLGREDYPDEDTLFSAYRQVAEQMQGKRAIIRTLDVGADKRIDYFGLPKEENPALGFRAIRVCLAREELFCTQLRAVLRASAFGRLALMLPMIVSVDEVRQTKRLLKECMDFLKQKGLPFDASLELGIMIETPAAVIMCEELAREVEFFSIGTNDLTQYTLAADRQNPALCRLCDENREPILRMIERAAEAIHHSGGWIGICGELAADLHLTQRFADMRIDELSVSVPYLTGVRGKVLECL